MSRDFPKIYAMFSKQFQVGKKKKSQAIFDFLKKDV